MSTMGMGSSTEKSLSFFQKHIGPGLKPEENLQGGMLSREKYDNLKQSFVAEGLAKADDPLLEEKFNHFLADALDGTLDQKSVPGLLEALGELGSHTEEANVLQFAQPKSFASSSDIPRLGKMREATTPAGRKTIEFQNIKSFTPQTVAPADKAPAQPLDPRLEPFREKLHDAGMLNHAGKDPLDVSINATFEKLEPEDKQLFLDCLRANHYEQAYSVLAVNRLKQTPGASTSPGLTGYMNALPNLSYGGPVTLEVNNPEQIHGASKVFSSSEVKPEVQLGVGDNQSFNYYSYCDVKQMPRTGPVYQATVINNPGPQTVKIRVHGSGVCNHEPSLEARMQQIQKTIAELKAHAPDDATLAKLDALAKLDILGPDGKLRTGNNDTITGSDGQSRVTGDLTRNADYLLTMEQILGIDMASADNPAGQNYIEIPAGQSMAVYTKIPLGSNTMRAAYQFEVLEPIGGQKLDVDVVVTENKSVGDPPKPIFPDKANSTCGMLPPSKDYRAALVEKLLMVNAGKELMQGDNYDDLLVGKKPRLEVTDEDQDGRITTGDMKFNNLRINQQINQIDLDILAKTQQIAAYKKKGTKEAIAAANALQVKIDTVLIPQKKGLQQQLFRLGRINGIKEGSEIRSTIPPINVSAGDVNLTYAVNTKVIERAGTNQDQSMKMLGISQFPNGPANLDDIAHGNYNAEYVISTQLVNKGDGPQQLYFSIGSPDAGGTNDNNSEPQKPSYDSTKTDNPTTRSRFTGVAEIQIAGRAQPILAKIVNGHVELPKEIGNLTIPSKESLYITVRFIIPTNSTGPQSLMISSKPPNAR